MTFCKAAHQFYFLDCCRTPMVDPHGKLPLGALLGSPGVGAAFNRHLNQFVYTIPARSITRATRDRVSAYTDLLMQSVRGAGAERKGRGWQVSAFPLLEGFKRVREAFEHVAPDGTSYPEVELDTGTPFKGNAVLHQYRRGNGPVVPTVLRCEPKSAAIAARYSVSRGAKSIPLTRHPSGEYHHVVLSPGKHCFQMSFPADTLPGQNRMLGVEPPVCECRFEA
jgi:hypothetical protein